MIDFNAEKWYWYVAGNDTHVYSSAIGDYVLQSDAEFQAWLAAGGEASILPTEDELGGLLAPYALRPIAAGVLAGYRNARVDKITIQDVAVYLFSLENRQRVDERARGEDKPNLTAIQFRNMLRNLV